MASIVTITPNPALNRVAIVEGDDDDRGVDVRTLFEIAGGSGISAGRVLRTLGREVVLTGFLAGNPGARIKALLDAESLAHEFVAIDGCTRRTFVYLDPGNRGEIEYKEPGPPIDAEAARRLIAVAKRLRERADFVLVCGSWPAGTSPELSTELTRAVTGGVRVAVDLEGEHLLGSAALRPHLAKCNRRQAERAFERAVRSEKDAADVVAMLQERGARSAIVTLGSRGSVLGSESGRMVAARLPDIACVDSAGCGDALLAAFVDGLMRGDDESDALAWGTAVAAANCLTPGVGRFSLATAKQLLSNVRVEDV